MKKDIDITELMNKAYQGDKKAQYDIGCYFEEGKGVGKDKIEAEKWLKKAALQNYGPAQYELAVLQRSNKNPEYWHWFVCASKNGEQRATNCINGHLERAPKHGIDATVMLQKIKQVESYIEKNGVNPSEDRNFLAGIDPSSMEGCFIATAVYGSYEAPQVIVLRNFRDDYLLNRAWGRHFVRFYYHYSPSFANGLKNRKYVKAIIKNVLNGFVRIVDGKNNE